jgi:SAM-dependent methyltransferase
MPILLRGDIEQTIDLARASIASAKSAETSVGAREPNLYLDSLGVSESEKEAAVGLARHGITMDPVVSVLVAATNGKAYKHLVGCDFDYPIPHIRLPRGEGKLLLDVGCSWGRWSIAAARKGYRVVGIDPSLSAGMAGKRVAKQLDLAIDYICADGRYLPFEDNTFDTIFSYSVIQHFSKVDAVSTLQEISRTLKPSGYCLIQMPNRLGMRNLLHLCKRRFSEGSGFDVRYWSIDELRRTFEQLIGPSEISVHCYFGLGLEPTDLRLMPRDVQLAISVSEWLRKLSAKASWITNLADSVYISSSKVRGTK